MLTGNVLALEYGKFLFGFVFKDAKIFRFEAVDEFAAVVEHGGVEDHQVHVELEDTTLLIILAGRSRLSGRKGEGVVLSPGDGSGSECEEKKEHSQEWLCHQNRTPQAISDWGRSSRFC